MNWKVTELPTSTFLGVASNPSVTKCPYLTAQNLAIMKLIFTILQSVCDPPKSSFFF